MRILLCCCLLAALAGEETPSTTTITTRDGTVHQVTGPIKVKTDGISFEVPNGLMKVKFRDLPADLQKKYNYDPFECGLLEARSTPRIKLSLKSAFRLADLEAAKAKALAEAKPLGFVMVWDHFFEKAGEPQGKASANGMAHFFLAFDQALVLVFVRHEDELDKVPEAVKKGFFGPDEGGFAPNLCVTSPDAKEYICEIPLGGGGSDGKIREPIFRKKIEGIKAWLAKNPLTPVAPPPAPPAPATPPVPPKS